MYDRCTCTANEDKLLIPLNYNAYSIVFYLNYKNAKRAKRVSRYYTEAQVLDAVSNPCIVHFTTCFMDGTRPWIENNNHPIVFIRYGSEKRISVYLKSKKIKYVNEYV